MSGQNGAEQQAANMGLMQETRRREDRENRVRFVKIAQFLSFPLFSIPHSLLCIDRGNATEEMPPRLTFSLFPTIFKIGECVRKSVRYRYGSHDRQMFFVDIYMNSLSLSLSIHSSILFHKQARVYTKVPPRTLKQFLTEN
jgi:hypothetical protein